MVRRKGNPFADLLRRLPHRAFIKREGPWRREDREEIEATCLQISDGAEHLIWSGSRGLELGCTVIGFDTLEKARAMQAWIDAENIAGRPCPQSPPDLPQLKCGD